MESQFTISSIIFIVCLIFPGVVFKRFYYQGQFTKQFGAGLFADRLITSIFWGIFVQIITFLIYSRSVGFTFTGIKSKVEKSYENIAGNRIPDVTAEHLTYILGYLVVLLFTSFFLGSIFHYTIRFFKIDLKFPVFRFANHWNYYFRGEIVSMTEFKSLKKGKWLSTMVDVLIEDGTEKNKMVSGFLTQHTISQKTGELETIYLTGAKRFSHTTRSFKEIPGDCLVIPFNKIVDLNLRYTFQAIDNSLKKKIRYNRILLTTLSVGLLLIITLPWYLKVSVFYTLLGISFSITAWLNIIILIFNPFKPETESKIKGKDLWIFFISVILFSTMALYFFNLIPGLN